MIFSFILMPFCTMTFFFYRNMYNFYNQKKTTILKIILQERQLIGSGLCVYAHILLHSLPNYPYAKNLPPSHLGSTALLPQAQASLGDICTTLSSLHILLSIQQRQGAAPALGAAIQEARKYYARAQEVRGDRILGRPGKESV